MEIKANEQEKKALIVIRTQTTKLIAQFNGLTIKNSKDLGLATGALSKITNWEKEVKKQEEKITKPIREGIRAAREFFKPLRDKITFLKGDVKMKIGDYSELIERKKAEKEKKLTEQIKNGEIDVQEASRKLEKIEVKAKALPMRKHERIEITNEKLIPQKYWELNMVLLRREALAGIKIPGVKVVEEKIVVSPKHEN